MDNGGTITASYAAASVSGNSGVHDLLGSNNGTITNSFWDTDIHATSLGGTGYTTTALRTPTAYGTGIYANWNLDLDGDNTADDPWDFGTSAQYPILKVDFDGDGTWEPGEFGNQRAGPDAPDIDSVTADIEQLTVAWSAADWDGGSDITAYDVRFILSSASDSDKEDDSKWTERLNAWQTGGGNLQYDITGLTSGASYDVQARASNVIANTIGTGKSDWSDTSTGTPTNSNPTFDDGATATRSVDENSPAASTLSFSTEAGPHAHTASPIWLWDAGPSLFSCPRNRRRNCQLGYSPLSALLW